MLSTNQRASKGTTFFPVRLRRLLGDVPIYSPFYAATEGLLGVNIAPDQAEDSSMQVYASLHSR
jgi:hypothetical protein